MTEGITGGREVRTRLTFFLPVANERQELAIRDIVGYLGRQRRGRLPVTGYTHSRYPDAAFSGLWWDEEKPGWVPDEVVLFIVDYQIPLHDPLFTKAMQRLKRAILGCYQRRGEKQEDIWIVAERVVRYT